MFNSRELNYEVNVDELLSPYLYLDETLFKGSDDGDASFKKFVNEGNGVTLPVRLKLERLANLILNEEVNIAEEEVIKYIDVFSLFSNHIDQQRFGEKPSQQDKERLVLLYLRAAYKLSPEINYDNLSEYDSRILSSHDQMLHYLGKAERYENVPVEERLTKLENSLKIARYLSTLSLSKEQDPHAFKNRIGTRELPVNYCYQDLNRFDDAAALIFPQLSSESAFHRTQANVQLAAIYIKQYRTTATNEDKLLMYANAAVSESMNTENTVLKYNARRCLMDAYQVLGCIDEANSLAQSIIDDLDADPNCGAKPLHREAAEKILHDNSQSVSFSV